MATLTSVGIQVIESDLTPVTQPQAASTGAYVGHFNWGPVDTVVNITSETALGQTYTTPTKTADTAAASFLTASSFLKYGNSLKVIRAADSGSARNSKGESTYGTPEPTLYIGNSELFNSLDPSARVSAFYARYPGEIGDALGIQIIHANNATTLASTVKDYFYGAPSTTPWADEVSNIDYDDDEIHVIIYDKTGELTGEKLTVIETWEGLSLAPEARTVAGSTNYWADVINTGSSYIYVGDTSDVATLTGGVYSLVDNVGYFSFSGGANGTRVFANVVNALVILEDIDNIAVNLIFAEAFETDIDANVNDALIGLVGKRKDAMVFLSAPLNLYKTTSDVAKLTALKTWRDSLANTSDRIRSFTVLDSTPVYVYNRYADNYMWIPACGHIAGLCAYTDEIADPWFSPAGFNRGQLRGVTKLAYNPKTADRDELYNSNINPIVNIPGQGIILYGDKTGQKRPSAFDRINVRRLFIAIQGVISDAAKYQLFELNDEFTRSAFINIINPYLRDIQGRRGIIEYKVVCDETNNTPQVIDSNGFVADIYVKPARSINYISLNFIATRTGVVFSELGA
jgi:hypothetical protein